VLEHIRTVHRETCCIVRSRSSGITSGRRNPALCFANAPLPKANLENPRRPDFASSEGALFREVVDLVTVTEAVMLHPFTFGSAGTRS
jgi:hypothetical protein